MANGNLPPLHEWTRAYQFEDSSGNPIDCGRDDCALGSYVISIIEERSDYSSPACTTCDFSGSCAEVFNADEERFEPGAPEDFKRGAARVMMNDSHSPIKVIQKFRPDTARMIEDYASTTPE